MFTWLKFMQQSAKLLGIRSIPSGRCISLSSLFSLNAKIPKSLHELGICTSSSLHLIKPDLSPKDDLFGIFTLWFVQNSLEMPLGVGTSKNDERIRIGKRIKEIREEKHLEAKTLSLLTGIDAANLCRIEQGKQSVGIDLLSKIANAMGYKIELVELKN